MAPLAAHLRTKPAPTEQPGEALSSWLNGFKEHALTPALFQRVFQTLVLRQADKRRNIPVPLYTTATRHETARSRRPITRACIHATPSAIISSTASRTSESIFISISSMSRVWCRKCVKCYLCRYFTLLFPPPPLLLRFSFSLACILHVNGPFEEWKRIVRVRIKREGYFASKIAWRVIFLGKVKWRYSIFVL